MMPIARHRAGAQPLTTVQREENRTAVHQAWKLHYLNVRRGLANGFYQGWDLHPAQLPARYSAVYAFFREGLASTAERLRAFMAQSAQATRVGNVFDDAATGQGLLNYFLTGRRVRRDYRRRSPRAWRPHARRAENPFVSSDSAER